jgi:hypothetical protein
MQAEPARAAPHPEDDAQRIVHSGHEPGPRAIQSALRGYRAAGVITVRYTGLSRANLDGPGTALGS